MDELENNLDATSFIPAVNNYQNELQDLITKIYLCYELMLLDKIELPYNNENEIRDILLNEYLQKRNVRNNICNIYGFRFDKEVDVNDGRVDIKIITLNVKDLMVNQHLIKLMLNMVLKDLQLIIHQKIMNTTILLTTELME